MWDEGCEVDDGGRALTARAGPYHLAVIADPDGSVTWSVGEGEFGEVGALDGVAGNVAAAKRAAVAEARRRWEATDDEIGALERERA